MPKVLWNLMFRVSNKEKAKAELKKALSNFESNVDIEAYSFEKYHKIPELWTCCFEIPIECKAPPQQIFLMLSDAQSIANGWNISCMNVVGENLEGFEGIFNKENSHSSISSLEWGHFQLSSNDL